MLGTTLASSSGMVGRQSGLALGALVLVFGCGGRVERGPEGDDPEAAAGNAAMPSKSGSGHTESPGIDPVADTLLGPCVLGRPEASAATCPWVADHLCYDARQMACNCSCPRDHDSQCLSSFAAGPNGHVEVSCF